MKIELHKITIRELIKGYRDSDEEGVVGYKGMLDIRPKYQRNFVYTREDEKKVISTIRKGFPLNIMYWVKREDGTFEVLDGQQRILSICHYTEGKYAVRDEERGEDMYFHNYDDDPAEQEKVLNYELIVYFCEGTPTEKLSWFRTINIAGLKLTDQELNNATFAGSWLTDAKRYFSKRECVAHKLGSKYVNPRYDVNRQGLLELALLWINNGDKEGLIEYMRVHQHEQSAYELWLYFQKVISWVEAIFPKTRKEMKYVDWGILYNKYKDVGYNPAKLEEEVSTLMQDDDVTNKKGIYSYVLTRDERKLNIRTFSNSIKRAVYERQNGKCCCCKKEYDISEMEGDHITPWSEGGKTTIDNCQMLCKDCNRRKSNK